MQARNRSPGQLSSSEEQAVFLRRGGPGPQLGVGGAGAVHQRGDWLGCCARWRVHSGAGRGGKSIGLLVT